MHCAEVTPLSKQALYPLNPSVTSVPCQACGVSRRRNSRTFSPLRLSLNWNTTALTGLALGVQYDQM